MIWSWLHNTENQNMACFVSYKYNILVTPSNDAIYQISYSSKTNQCSRYLKWIMHGSHAPF